MADKHLSPVARWIVGLICIFVFGGLGFFGAYGFGIQSLVEGFRVRNWVATPCTIEQSKLAYEEVANEDGGTDLVEKVKMVYSYEVDGRPYKADRVAVSWLEPLGQEFVDENPAGTKRDCYVNPDDPTRAVLIPTIPGRAWLMSGTCGVVFILVGLFFTAMGWSLIRGDRRR
jgi:hypothetical protein